VNPELFSAPLRFVTEPLRAVGALILWSAAAVSPAQAQVTEPPRQDAWSRLGEAQVVLFRHGNAPGVGDPGDFKLGDCRTQRNLDETGRQQARQIGRAFVSRGVSVGAVWASPWCRTRETADLAFPGRTEIKAPFASFFEDRASEARFTREAQALMQSWKGPGLLVVLTHQVNITALTGIFPASAEGVMLGREGSGFKVIGRLPP
jgi:phosphohistidine phosphatase SixA